MNFKSKTIISGMIYLLTCNQIITAQVFEKGKTIASIGYGFPNRIAQNLSGQFIDISSKSNGPFIAKGEFGFSKHIGLGLHITYLDNKVRFVNRIVNNKDSIFINVNTQKTQILAKGNYHFFPKSKRLDFFGGIGIGMNIGAEKVESIDKSWRSRTGFTPIDIELGAGLRWKVAKNIGIFGEANLNETSRLQAGIWYKFNKKIRSFRE